MSIIPTTQIDGDVTVGRNVTAGGNVEVQGSVRVGHDLKVEGWLEAKNIKSANKGLYTTVAKLREAYSRPHDGWFAGVSATEADFTRLGVTAQQGISYFVMYVGDGGEWVPTDKLYQIVIDNQRVESLNADVDDIRTTVGQHTQQIETLRDVTVPGVQRQVNDLSERLNEAKTAVADIGKLITTVDFSDIDTVRVTSETGDLTPTRLYKVLNGSYCVGWILCESYYSCGVGQTFFTNLTMVEGGFGDTPSHVDGAFHIYRRYYNKNASTSPVVIPSTGESVAKGSWSKWHEVAGDGLLESLGALRESVRSEVAALNNKITPLRVGVSELRKAVEGIAIYPMSAIFDTRGDIDNQDYEDGRMENEVVYIRDEELFCRFVDDGSGELLVLERANEYMNGSKPKTNAIFRMGSELYYYSNGLRKYPNDRTIGDINDDVVILRDDLSTLEGRMNNLAQDFADYSPLGNDFNVFNERKAKNEPRVVGETTTYYDDLESAVAYAVGKGVVKPGVHIIFAESEGTWSNYSYVGSSADNPTDSTLWEAFGDDGGGFYNVTNKQPLGRGQYYTKESAIAALATAGIKDTQKFGTIITFETSAGVWEEYRFIGSNLAAFRSPAAWEEYGGGTIKGVSVNGTIVEPDPSGTVPIIIPTVEVDESLDPVSTRPVQNAAVTERLNALESKAVGELDITEVNGVNVLTILNSEGTVIASGEFAAGGGGQGGTGTASKIVIGAELDKEQVKEGGDVTLTWSYNHVDAEGVPDGVKGDVTITAKRGSTVIYQQTIKDVATGTEGEVELGKYLLAGTVDVYVKADAVTADDIPQTKQAYAKVSVVTLKLESSYNLANTIANGGYRAGDEIEIPYTINGSGTRVVKLYIDGAQYAAQSINTSGVVAGSFVIPASTLASGGHTVQLQAERGGILSDSIFISIFRGGLNNPFVGIKYTDKSGTIQPADCVPQINGGQYENIEFDYVAYDPAAIPATVNEYHGGVLKRTFSAPRLMQRYTNRFTDAGDVDVRLECGGVGINFTLAIAESNVALAEATQGLALKLSAAGRSNTESADTRSVWANNGVSTTFRGVDWKSSGWIGDALHLMNGAQAVIGIQPFAVDAKATGLTVEVEFKISNVLDRTQNVITCISDGKGFQVTAEEASMYTGNSITYTDEDGNEASRLVGVGSKFAADRRLKVAFVLHKSNDGRLMELYVNGIRSKADIYQSGDVFQQEYPMPITINSDLADVDVYSVRVYNRALTDDELLANYIVDRPDIDEMMNLYQSNDVMNELGTSVDLDAIRRKGKGVMLFVRPGGLDPVNATNDKSADFLTDVYFYSPFGKEYDFVLRNCYMRIQGTSSTKYPRKNYRIYFNKGVNPELTVNGVVQGDSNKYAMRPGAIPMNLFCMKCDYSDSSMTHNTGSAKLFNDVMKELGLLTPPQQHDDKVRAAIDGFPIDVFAAETADGEPQYYGQYNFNNEKSKSGKLFGMEGVSGFTATCPIALESLNNGNAFCLFQPSGSASSPELEAQMLASFDSGMEFNYPEDVFYNPANVSDPTKQSVATSAQKTALKRLYGWLWDVTPAAMRSNPDYTDISKWVSPDFAAQVSAHFDVNYLLTYYLITDYWASVDQRAKNILWRTWDGIIWYPTFYDGDTAFLVRNDSFLAYLYDVERETWDAEKTKYAFEGHDSWLWCLVLANLTDNLQECATALRGKLSNERMLEMYNVTQAGNWSERQYNKSGEFKYILPQTNGVMVGETLTRYSFIYALQGNRSAHREHTIVNRGALLDAKYSTGKFKEDNIDAYISRGASDAANTIRIVANELYYFGYGTNNTPYLQPTQRANAGDEVTLSVSGYFSTNDPIRIYGASRIRELDLTGACNIFQGNLGLNKCRQLRKFVMRNDTATKQTFTVDLDACAQLREVDIHGQRGCSVGAAGELDFSNQTKLERLAAGGVNATTVTLAQGAPITYLEMPDGLTTLRLEYLPNLTMAGLTIADYSAVSAFRFAGCPGIDWQELLSQCAAVQRVRVELDESGASGDARVLQGIFGKQGLDVDGNATSKPVVQGRYTLSDIITAEEVAEIQDGIEGIDITITIATIINAINAVNAGDYSGAVDDGVEDEITLDNIINHIRYYNGESEDEAIARFIAENY